jgi:hypothetical protein
MDSQNHRLRNNTISRSAERGIAQQTRCYVVQAVVRVSFGQTSDTVDAQLLNT